MDTERGSLGPENRSSALLCRSAACSAVRRAFRLVTTANRTLLLPSRRVRGGAGGVSAFSVSVLVSTLSDRVRISVFSATARQSDLGLIPAISQLTTDSEEWEAGLGGRPHIKGLSANPINRHKTYSWESV